jgi:predicted lipase
MKKYTIIFFIVLFQFNLNAQVNPEFDKEEAMNLVAICNYWLNGKIEGVDSTYIDSSYVLLYESKLFKMDNRWQLWQKGDDAIVINLRGTTREAISWMENFYAAMIPAQGEIFLPDSQKFEYQFAKDPKAAVHTGWAMGIGFMLEDILSHIKDANRKGIYKVFITGHSQGGVLAHLLRAQFQYLPEERLSKKNSFKVYAFAPPKPGNRFFNYDYSSYCTYKNPSYSIINKADWVPQVPFSVQSTSNMVDVTPFSSFENGEFKIPLFKRIIAKRFYKSLKNPADKSRKRFKKKLGKTMKKQIRKKVGEFEVPDYVDDFSYFPVGLPIILGPISGESPDPMFNIFWQHMPGHYYLLIKEMH